VGSWESTIEGMNVTRVASADLGYALRASRRRVDVWDELTWDVEFMDEKIERYVLYGGRITQG
jgi:hypothetical protein